MNCTRLPATLQDAGLVALGSTLPSGMAVLGQVDVRLSLLASINPKSIFFGDPYCSYQVADYNTHSNYYLDIRTKLFATFGPASPELLLDSSGKVSVLKAKTSAYYLMKFKNCSGTSCQVKDASVDSVADSILFGNPTWGGPVNSQYPSDGVVVFMVNVRGGREWRYWYLISYD